MTDKTPSKNNAKDIELLKGLKNTFYSVIIPSDELSEPVLADNGLDPIDEYAILLHCALWRSGGPLSNSTSGYINELHVIGLKSSENTIISRKTYAVWYDIAAAISKKIIDTDYTVRAELFKANESFLSMFVDGASYMPLIKKTNSIGLFGDFFSLAQTPSKKVTPSNLQYSLSARCVDHCLSDMVLGVGSTPIYVPIVVTRGKARSMSLFAIFADNPFYDIFLNGIKEVLSNKDVKENSKKFKEAKKQSQSVLDEALEKMRKGKDDKDK